MKETLGVYRNKMRNYVRKNLIWLSSQHSAYVCCRIGSDEEKELFVNMVKQIMTVLSILGTDMPECFDTSVDMKASMERLLTALRYDLNCDIYKEDIAKSISVSLLGLLGAIQRICKHRDYFDEVLMEARWIE